MWSVSAAEVLHMVIATHSHGLHRNPFTWFASQPIFALVFHSHGLHRNPFTWFASQPIHMVCIATHFCIVWAKPLRAFTLNLPHMHNYRAGVTKILNKKYIMSFTLHTAPTTDCAFEASPLGPLCKRCQKHRNRHVNFVGSSASDLRASDFANKTDRADTGGLKASTSSRANCFQSTKRTELKHTQRSETLKADDLQKITDALRKSTDVLRKSTDADQKSKPKKAPKFHPGKFSKDTVIKPWWSSLVPGCSFALKCSNTSCPAVIECGKSTSEVYVLLGKGNEFTLSLPPSFRETPPPNFLCMMCDQPLSFVAAHMYVYKCRITFKSKRDNSELWFKCMPGESFDYWRLELDEDDPCDVTYVIEPLLDSDGKSDEQKEREIYLEMKREEKEKAELKEEASVLLAEQDAQVKQVQETKRDAEVVLQSVQSTTSEVKSLAANWTEKLDQFSDDTLEAMNPQELQQAERQVQEDKQKLQREVEQMERKAEQIKERQAEAEAKLEQAKTSVCKTSGTKPGLVQKVKSRYLALKAKLPKWEKMFVRKMDKNNNLAKIKEALQKNVEKSAIDPKLRAKLQEDITETQKLLESLEGMDIKTSKVAEALDDVLTQLRQETVNFAAIVETLKKVQEAYDSLLLQIEDLKELAE
eukprot:g77311.t1